jgi:diacylglycerol kinase (ATP)
MKDVFVVINPGAGGGNADSICHSIQDHFQSKGWEHALYETTGQDHDHKMIRNAINDGYTYFVAVGGDGTISDVAECLIGKDITLGILPTGTGNGIARALSIPLKLDDALQVITQESRFKHLDAMQLAGRSFFLMIGIGLSATALKQAQIDQKRFWGRLYYSFLALKASFGFHPHRFHMKIDGEPHVAHGSEILLLNCGTIGDPLLQWEENISVNDGAIDVYVIRARTIYDYFRLAWNAIAGQERQDPSVSAFRMEHTMHVQTQKPLPVQGDGDFIQHTPVKVTVVPQAVKVLVPAER